MESSKKRKLFIAMIATLLLSCCCFAVSISAVSADGVVERNLQVSGITVTSGDKTLQNCFSDPITYHDEAYSGALTRVEIKRNSVSATANVVYTALYPYTTTRRTGTVTEYTVESVNGKYEVTKIGSGNSYIPVGGFVISCGGTAPGFAVGDEILLSGTALKIPTMAVENETGSRVVVDYLNATRSSPMVVYYDYQSGATTGTNAFGTEMVATYNEKTNSFVVNKFRAFGEGGAAGIEIPDNSFVLSGYGEGYRGLLVEDQLFSLGDKLTLVNIDYIRFGTSVQASYDYIDPKEGENPYGMETATSPFPAYRGTNQTIIYNYGWSWNGAAGTGANVYGFEVAVDAEGVVVERNVTVSAIPEGGYAISGHGTGRDFLRSNVPLGATVVLDTVNKTYTVSTSLNSFFVNVQTAVESAINSARTKVTQLYDVASDEVEANIAAAEAALGELIVIKKNIEDNVDGWDAAERMRNLMTYNMKQLEVEALSNEIIYTAMESKPVSARSVWHRPTEKSLAEITESLDIYDSCGINLIFVESFFNGYSMFKSENVSYHPDFTNAVYGDYADYLTAFAAEAKKRGIEVHAWVEDFYVGLSATVSFVANNPSWIIYNEDGTFVQRNEGGAYIFIDPANPEVQDFLINYYLELLEKVPDITGLNLDYIRYPVSDEDQDTGYSKVAMLEFADSVGVTRLDQSQSVTAMITEFRTWVLNSDYNVNAEQNYKLWVQYRTDKVTQFVERVYREIKKEKNIVLSTAVFSSITESRDSKKQDWPTWFSNGWIDIATPMAYYDDATDVLKNVSDMILMAGNACYYYTGLASSYRGLPSYESAIQISASYDAGASGYVIFCSTQVLGSVELQEVLKAGVNSADAVLPHADVKTVVKAYFDRIVDRAERIYIPAEGMTEDGLTALKAKFAEINAMNASTAKEVNALMKAVSDIYKSNGVYDYAVGYSARRIEETLKELYTLLDTKLSRTMIDTGVWNPETTPVRPDPENAGTDPVDPPDPVKPTGNGCSSLAAGEGWLIAAAALIAAVFLRRSAKKN